MASKIKRRLMKDQVEIIDRVKYKRRYYAAKAIKKGCYLNICVSTKTKKYFFGLFSRKIEEYQLFRVLSTFHMNKTVLMCLKNVKTGEVYVDEFDKWATIPAFTRI